MDKEIEFDFTRKFIRKEKRERILYELCSHRKRETAIQRFAHDVSLYIKQDVIVYAGIELEHQAAFISLKKQLLDRKQIYIIGTLADGKFIDIHDGLHFFYNEYKPVILLSNEIALIKEEAEFGAPMRFLL